MAARYGRPPWEMEDVPMVYLMHWYDIAVENLADEGAIYIGGALSKMLK